MATLDLPVLGMSTVPDASDDVFQAPIKSQITIGSTTRPPGNELCMVMKDPNGAGDQGIYGKFNVPQGYVGTPVLVIRGILDGAPSTLTIAFGVQMNPLADNEAYDADLGTEDTASASSVSHVDEDVYEETISLSNTFATGDEVAFFFYIDDGTHTYTGNFLLTGLFFRYNDA